ncbi:enolase C-terminal domain-like protein [uncultured Desulfosarcina sp.]|uniref:enolase C-terminal domain-like protein n=1 Tax=uncultured Desulfosarcina sp. TaxID=218289 RepID=UPI0029C6F396|nr:enolase C-terminal domain-like protein [uncultured Desulfosarcina sp.]
MKILDIVDGVFPISSAIENAYISFAEMTCSAVAVVTDQFNDGERVVGFGFHSNGRYDQQGILRSRMIKRLNRAGARGFLNTEGTNVDPDKAWRVMMANEKPGGHGERSVAVGTVDMAMWDLAAKLEGKPLFKLLAERHRDGISDDSVYVYAAGGYYYPEKGIEGLTEEMQSYLDLGYDTIKIKIGGASLSDDCRRIEAVLALLGPGQTLAVDANGRFDLSMALKYAQALNQYDLKWFEEPGDPLDFKLLAEVANVSRNPLATGENLFSTQDARNLIRYGGLRTDRDILQIDPALSYGLVEYLRYLKMLKNNGWNSRSCIPHGGHQFSLHLAAGLGLGGNESYPGLFAPFGGFADDAVIKEGRIELANVPGIGIEEKYELMKLYRGILNENGW